MSQPEIDGEQEVDFGRYWLAIIRRWWLPIGGIVVGLVIGVVAQSGGSRPYQAMTTVYLGQTFAPGTVNAVESLPTKLSFVDQLVKTRGTLKAIGTKVGINPGILGSNTSFQTISGITTGKSAGAPSPIVAVVVVNPSARKAVDAADLFAAEVVSSFSSYAKVKLATYQARLARAEREMAVSQVKADALQKTLDDALKQPTLTGAEKYLLIASLSNQIQFQQQRQFNLESSQFALKDTIALNQQIEQSRIVQPGSAVRISAPSKRTGGAVGLVIGFLVGLLAAIFWEPSTRLLARARTAD